MFFFLLREGSNYVMILTLLVTMCSLAITTTTSTRNLRLTESLTVPVLRTTKPNILNEMCYTIMSFGIVL